MVFDIVVALLITILAVVLGITVHPVLLFIIVLAIVYLVVRHRVVAGSEKPTRRHLSTLDAVYDSRLLPYIHVRAARGCGVTRARYLTRPDRRYGPQAMPRAPDQTGQSRHGVNGRADPGTSPRPTACSAPVPQRSGPRTCPQHEPCGRRRILDPQGTRAARQLN
jgi:hypothetical protein